jgi:hypothetical protein
MARTCCRRASAFARRSASSLDLIVLIAYYASGLTLVPYSTLSTICSAILASDGLVDLVSAWIVARTSI